VMGKNFAKELLGTPMLRVAEEGVGRCFLDDLPSGHVSMTCPTAQASLSVRRHASAFPRHDLPEFLLHLLTLSLERAQGRPGAGWHPWASVPKKCTRNAQRKHRAAETTRPSLRDGLTAYAGLSSVTNSLLSPSPRRLAMQFARLGLPHLRESLAVATTAGTTRFCRTHRAPFVRHACKELTGLGSIHCPALRLTSAPTLAASTAIPAHDRDDVRPPLSLGWGVSAYAINPNSCKANIRKGRELIPSVLDEACVIHITYLCAHPP
jgi:hypothetical protein